MEIKVKKSFIQKSTLDSTLENFESKVKSAIKEKKFTEMVDRLGKDKLKEISSL